MQWFVDAAAPFADLEIKVVSETIPTHEYEAKVLTKAFEEITGIKVSFDLIQEGDVIAIDGKALRCARVRYLGNGRVHHLRAGYTFELTEHPHDAMNRSYLAVQVQHYTLWFSDLPQEFEGYRILLLVDLHLDGLEPLSVRVWASGLL